MSIECCYQGCVEYFTGSSLPTLHVLVGPDFTWRDLAEGMESEYNGSNEEFPNFNLQSIKDYIEINFSYRMDERIFDDKDLPDFLKDELDLIGLCPGGFPLTGSQFATVLESGRLFWSDLEDYQKEFYIENGSWDYQFIFH